MRIVKLIANNLKRLTAVEIRPDGNVVEIRGKNGAGKSSVIDSIAYALGGQRLCPDEPIRHGQQTASVNIDLGDLRVRRSWTRKASVLTLTNADGVPAKSPQAILDKVVGALTFDPLQFIHVDDAQQRQMLVDVTGVAERMRELSRREEANRSVRRDAKAAKAEIEGAAKQIKYPSDTPAEPVSIATLTDRLEKSREIIEANNAIRQSVVQAAEAVRIAEGTVDRLIGDLEAAQKRVKLIETELERARATSKERFVHHTAVRAQVETLADPELQPIREQIRAAEATNQCVELRKRKIEYDGRISLLQATIDQAQQAIDGIQSERQDLLHKANYPVEGLSFGEIGVRFNGVPFDQCSSAEQLRVSLAMAMKMNPKLRILLVRDGSLLDKDSLRILYETVTANDYQLWIERVGDDGETGIVIEDGAVAGVHTGDSTPREHPTGEATMDPENRPDPWGRPPAMVGTIKQLEATMQCNCDLDNWEPERSTGHSHVCRIHKAAMAGEITDADIAETQPPKPEDSR